MSRPETKRRPGIVNDLEVAGRHALSVGGGITSATLAYFGGEAVFKAMGFISRANEAGLISESGALSAAEAIKGAALAYASFKTFLWSADMHNKARAKESGTPRAPKRGQ